MKVKFVNELPKCDFRNDYPHPDGKDASYDAPVIGIGSWANMCKECAMTRADISPNALGTIFFIREKKEGVEEIVKANEPGLDDVEYWENIVYMDEPREPECPICGEIRRLEPDASDYKHDDGLVYGFICEGCDTKVSIGSGVM